MSEFDVKPGNLKNEGSTIKQVEKEINTIQSDVDSIKDNISFKAASAATIRQKLYKASQALLDEKKNAESLGTALNMISDKYISTENALLGNSVEEASPEVSNGAAEATLESPWFTQTKGKYEHEFKSRDTKTAFKGYYDFKKKKWVDKTPKKRKDGYDKKSGRPKKKELGEELKKSIKDVKVYEKEAKAEAMLWGANEKAENYEYDVKVLDAEAHASGYAGLNGFDKDGKRIFRPGVGGEVGASVTAFTAAGKLKAGSDMLGAYVGGDVTVGKAEAKAEGKLGFGKDGFHAYGAASAEAIAAEAHANVGAKLAGTDIKGDVGVNFGVGAHAKAGYSNGKLSLDLGVSVGLGVSANVEIDFSGTVNAVKDVAKGVGDTVSGCFSKLKKLF